MVDAICVKLHKHGAGTVMESEGVGPAKGGEKTRYIRPVFQDKEMAERCDAVRKAVSVLLGHRANTVRVHVAQDNPVTTHSSVRGKYNKSCMARWMG